MNQLQLPPDQEKFRLEHEMVAKMDRLDALKGRHNYLVGLLPKEIVSQDVQETFQLTMAEINKNMTEYLALRAELEALCATEVNKTDVQQG